MPSFVGVTPLSATILRHAAFCAFVRLVGRFAALARLRLVPFVPLRPFRSMPEQSTTGDAARTRVDLAGGPSPWLCVSARPQRPDRCDALLADRRARELEIPLSRGLLARGRMRTHDLRDDLLRGLHAPRLARWEGHRPRALQCFRITVLGESFDASLRSRQAKRLTPSRTRESPRTSSAP
jgi:hypothetical protein